MINKYNFIFILVLVLFLGSTVKPIQSQSIENKKAKILNSDTNHSPNESTSFVADKFDYNFTTKYKLPKLRKFRPKTTTPLKVSPDYKYWPGYQKFPAEMAQAQNWRNEEDIIEGWDWSLPNSVQPSSRSLICLSRTIEKFPKPDFNSNPVISIWFNWSDIEPREGIYDFGRLYKMIERADSQGYGVIFRPITAVWKRVYIKNPESSPDWMLKNSAPKYLVEKYGLKPKAEKIRKSDRANLQNLDPANPIFHKFYCKMVKKFGESGLLHHPAVKGVIVGYKSHSWGDEGIGPHGEMKGTNEPEHVIERLDAWAEATKGVEYKVCMGGASEYGFSKGFGMRGGFVEMYLYRLPAKYEGQYLDHEGYIINDPDSPLINTKRFSGDENEEYEEWWKYRFGPIESFPFRYFTSTLRYLQMERNYILNNPFIIYPEMLAWASLQLGKNIEESPEVWCHLRESYMKKENYENKDYRNRQYSQQEKRSGILAVKNFERGLIQRDRPGFETQPVEKINHSYTQWMVHTDKAYDYIARKGKNIGFEIHPDFISKDRNYALKISYLDKSEGLLKISGGVDKKEIGSFALTGDQKLKTATLFLEDITFESKAGKFDIILSGIESEVVVSMVRLIKR